MNFFINKANLTLKPLFALSQILIKIYGESLKFFLKLNGGYWGRIGIGKYSNIEKKRNFIILPFYILLALLFFLFSSLYWYLILFYIPVLLKNYLIEKAQWNDLNAFIFSTIILLSWLYILIKAK